jgi:hypothetical protein
MVWAFVNHMPCRTLSAGWLSCGTDVCLTRHCTVVTLTNCRLTPQADKSCNTVCVTLNNHDAGNAGRLAGRLALTRLKGGHQM